MDTVRPGVQEGLRGGRNRQDYSQDAEEVVRMRDGEAGSLGQVHRLLLRGVPRTVLAKHYTDFSPSKLKEVYEKAGLKVLE